MPFKCSLRKIESRCLSGPVGLWTYDISYMSNHDVDRRDICMILVIFHGYAYIPSVIWQSSGTLGVCFKLRLLLPRANVGVEQYLFHSDGWRAQTLGQISVMIRYYHGLDSWNFYRQLHLLAYLSPRYHRPQLYPARLFSPFWKQAIFTSIAYD